MLVALLMLGLITLIGLAALSTSDEEISIAGNELQEMRAFYAAEAGLEQAAALIQRAYDSTGVPPTYLPAGTLSVNQSRTVFGTIDNGAATQQVITQGSLSGLYALVKSFTVDCEAANPIDNARIILSQEFQTSLVPIFQFAVFYDHDLWATPAFDMDITGRVHVNGDMRLQAFTQLRFRERVTASGSIYHGLANGQYSTASGDVMFEDRVGMLRGMHEGGNLLDASDSHWYDSALARWGGQVQDEAFGQDELSLPLTGADDPHKIIERGSGNPDSYQHKAGFQVIDGVPSIKVGSIWQDATSLLPSGTVTSSSFYDAREGEWVDATEIDVGKLTSSGYFPANGVIYASDQTGGYNGLRLVNGDDVGTPMSVFSQNPVYVQGDFNTVDKQPVAVVADAMTFLSNSWDDSKSNSRLSSRKPTSTTVNLAFIAGDSEPTSNNYGGGLENLPRFLEDWEGETFKFRGSMNALWRSRQALADWSYDYYYTAPTRDWGFDKDFTDPNKLPPETPMVRYFESRGWQQKYVGTYSD